MAKIQKPSTQLPTRKQLVQFVSDSRYQVGKREIARAFHLAPEQKRELKKLLRELTLDGSLKRTRGQKYLSPQDLPEVTVLTIAQIDPDGELIGLPTAWPEEISPPRIYINSDRQRQPALRVGDRALVRLTKQKNHEYNARIIRRIAPSSTKVLGLYKRIRNGGRLLPTDRRQKGEFAIPDGYDLGAAQGELVEAEVFPGKHFGLKQAKVIHKLGVEDGPSWISAIAVHENEIPDSFSKASLDAADAAREAPFKERSDLRNIPLVTIDGSDAKDFDDAVWAEPDPETENIGGWHLLVAIADVAWYVRPGEPLDHDAKERGNSVYFPDRVIPMLPEALSNGLCSLRPGEDRPCLAVHMWIDKTGKLTRHKFVRGIMKSAARLTYEQVQSAWDGNPDNYTKNLLSKAIIPLYGAFRALLIARKKRGTLDLEVPERRIELADDGTVIAIRHQERLDSHRIIEEFMITANVAAAETLENFRQPCMYRVHNQPSNEKLQTLDQFLRTLNFQFTKGQVIKPHLFNRILRKFSEKPEAHMISQMILRSQAQAEYSPANIGHFGLALRSYAHFTSPIRRYADLLVHRSLIQSLNFDGCGSKSYDEDLTGLSRHISMTERRGGKAERDTFDRFTALFHVNHINKEFSGRVNGVSKAGLFVTLMETGADGLVPMRTLPNDYYDLDPNLQTLIGSTNGLVFRLGQELRVQLNEAIPIKGSLILSIVDYDSSHKSAVPVSKSKRYTNKGKRQSRSSNRLRK